jgi:PIN domain nuclease of toxin-antitoxin system
MNVLVDTHIFLWYIFADAKLTERWRDFIRTSENKLYLSVISIWECLIKASLGKLDMQKPWFDFIEKQAEISGFEILPLSAGDLRHLEQLPVIHKDPFDRILICQTMENNLVLMTDDKLIKRYQVNIFEPND